jgi:hypothetical protein
MKKLIERVELKLQEYGIEIFDHYELEKKDYLFIVEEMLIIVHNNNENISVAFQVSTKPEIAANNILILQEIKQIKNISIMESFAFSSKNEMFCGEKAYKLLQDSLKEDIACDIEKRRMYQNILLTTDGFEC